MNNENNIIACSFSLFLSGCATVYRHPVKSGSALEQDRQECERISRANLTAKGVPDT
ncbi:MAG TPA: hypothetical protein VGJ94_05920 [Syntrophorhabdaceae bacterium]